MFLWLHCTIKWNRCLVYNFIRIYPNFTLTYLVSLESFGSNRDRKNLKYIFVGLNNVWLHSMTPWGLISTTLPKIPIVYCWRLLLLVTLFLPGVALGVFVFSVALLKRLFNITIWRVTICSSPKLWRLSGTFSHRWNRSLSFLFCKTVFLHVTKQPSRWI